jgi:Gpi18-like mannosyltransferase
MFWFALIFAGIAVKICLLPVATGDYTGYFQSWIATIDEEGAIFALKNIKCIPIILYILIFIVKIGVNPLVALKVFAILFEYLLAFFVGKIAFLKYKDVIFVWIALSIVPLVPTVVLNSAYLTQSDAVYSALAMGSVYFLLKKSPLISVLLFALAFAYKMQAVMLLPFFFVMLLRRNVKWSYFLLIPAVYAFIAVPAWLTGRSFGELMTVFFNQSANFGLLTINFPNIYIWFDNANYNAIMPVGIAITCLSTLICGILLSRRKIVFTFEQWIRLVFLSAIIVPFLLPSMHERYMFLGDVAGILYFLILRKNVHFPIGIILVSLYSYLRCSRYNEVLPMQPAFFLYFLIIILAIVDFVKNLKIESR